MTKMKETILIIEDDPSISKGLEKNLRFEGFSVLAAADGELGLELALDKTPDLILLDVMMPKMNGFEVLEELKRRDIEIPVIMLTAKGEEIDKVQGLKMGADDYVTKPFGLKELLARIQAVLRRKRRFDKKQDQVSFGQVSIEGFSSNVKAKPFKDKKSWIEYGVTTILGLTGP
jgi:DNA-binding response OmpR family regulator